MKSLIRFVQLQGSGICVNGCLLAVFLRLAFSSSFSTLLSPDLTLPCLLFASLEPIHSSHLPCLPTFISPISSHLFSFLLLSPFFSYFPSPRLHSYLISFASSPTRFIFLPFPSLCPPSSSPSSPLIPSDLETQPKAPSSSK